MKKILLLSITSLALLMADFTLIGKQLTPLTEPAAETTPPVVELTPPPATTGPVNTSGIIPNSVDLIWEDVTTNNVVFPATMPSSYGQFSHGYTKPIQQNTEWTSLSPWFEIESQGTGNSCSGDTNTASNTYVEVGHGRTYALIGGSWQQVGNTLPSKHGGSQQYPTGPDSWERSGCRGDAWSHILKYPWTVNRTTPEGSRAFFPKYGYRFHGWSNRYTPSEPRKVQAFFYTVYMRLSLIDPSGPDDRSAARFVAHVGTDWWDLINGGGLMYDVGIAKYKKVTSDWVAFSFISGDFTKAELEANPPPLALEP